VTPARALVHAARPRTLPAAVAPVLVGWAIAWAAGSLRPLPAAATLLFAILIQVATNYANDVLDFERGTDTAARVGPLRVTQAGLVSPGAMKLATAAAFGLAALDGLYLAAVAGWGLLVIGVVSIAAGLAYTGGPSPLAYNGLADLFVMAFFGFVAVCGTVYVQLGQVPPLAFAAALPIGALATAILVVNNVRDVETDAAAGRRTLPVRFGRRFGVVEYAALLALAFASPPAIAAAGLAGPWVLLPLVLVPLAFPLLRSVARERGPALNATLAGTGRLLLLFAVLLAAGIAWGGRAA
jgi:1,4-dihydroxy-2-naphthoate octaprenyltransferase